MKTNSSLVAKALRQLINYLDRKRRIQLIYILLVMLLSGLMEIVSLGSVLPFLTVISSSDKIYNLPIVGIAATRLGLTSPSTLVIFSTICFSTVIIISGCIRLLALRFNTSVAASFASDLSLQAYSKVIRQPYSDQIQTNSSYIINTLTLQLNSTVGALNTFLQFASSAIISSSIVISLFIVDAFIASSLIALFASGYIITAFLTRNRLSANSKQIAFCSQSLVRTIQESLGAIRDIILDNSFNTFIDRYESNDFKMRKLQSSNKFLSSFPRFAIESLGMISIALMGSVLVIQYNSEVTVIFPILGVFALGAQRLLPALQQVYGAWASLKGSSVDVLDFLKLLEINTVPRVEAISTTKELNSVFSIRLNGVSYRYPGAQDNAIKNIDLELADSNCIGIVGPTGGGKSTLVDVIMGLLPPTAGHLYINEIDVYDSPNNLYDHRSRIAHVPQSIYLSDQSILDNITLDSSGQNINRNLLDRAINVSMLNEFIESSPLGIKTLVGERGVKISGGQKQRIGIARAIYKNPKILILDEATSALDGHTESQIMNKINELCSDVIVIMIAHRLASLKHCSVLYKISNGDISGPLSLESLVY